MVQSREHIEFTEGEKTPGLNCVGSRVVPTAGLDAEAKERSIASAWKGTLNL
jgi:hypothetical protein